MALVLAAGMTVSLGSCGEENEALTKEDIESIAESESVSLYSYDDMSYNILGDESSGYTISITGVENEYRSSYYIPSQIEGITVRDINDYAFSYASIAEVGLPASLYTIGSGAFYDCAGLTAVKIPSGVRKIGSYAFYHCVLLDEIEIPDGVKEIGGLAFYGTRWLEKQTDEFVVVGDGILIDYNGMGGNVVVPEGVKSISSAFCKNEKIESVVLPESVEYIGEAAFMGCVSLKSINLPASVKRIGDSAFRGCRLLSLDVPEGIETGFMALDFEG